MKNTVLIQESFEKIANIHGYTMDPERAILWSPIVAYYGNKSNIKNKIIFFSYIKVLSIVITLKSILKISRKNKIHEKKNTYIICKSAKYDIPSGHAAVGTLTFLILRKQTKLALFFICQPVSRYISGAHSLPAVVLGTVIAKLIHYRNFN